MIDADELRALCLEAGADDVGFVSVDNPALAGERKRAEGALPGACSYLSIVLRMNVDSVRSPARSIANLEFHHTGDEVNTVARRIVTALNRRGHRALNPAAGFPQEMTELPGRAWVISLKTVAASNCWPGRCGRNGSSQPSEVLDHPVNGTSGAP